MSKERVTRIDLPSAPKWAQDIAREIRTITQRVDDIAAAVERIENRLDEVGIIRDRVRDLERAAEG